MAAKIRSNADGTVSVLNGTVEAITVDAAGHVSFPVQEALQGTVQFWVAFNGTGTVAILDDYNVSSITDGGTGRYDVNFAEALANADICVVGTRTHAVSISYAGVLTVESVDVNKAHLLSAYHSALNDSSRVSVLGIG